MTWLTWQKKRVIAFVTIAIAGLAHINILSLNKLIAPITEYIVIGEIKIITIIGLVTIVLAYMLYNKRIIG